MKWFVEGPCSFVFPRPTIHLIAVDEVLTTILKRIRSDFHITFWADVVRVRLDKNDVVYTSNSKNDDITPASDAIEQSVFENVSETIPYMKASGFCSELAVSSPNKDGAKSDWYSRRVFQKALVQWHPEKYTMIWTRNSALKSSKPFTRATGKI